MQSEEAAFPPAAEDEEMEVSGTSGNEEEMAEEAEGEAGRGRGRAQPSRQCHTATAERFRGHPWPFWDCKCQRSQGAACATLKPHRGDAVPQHEALVTFRMPRDFTLARAALDRCPPPLSVGRDVYFGKVVQCKGSVTSRPLLGTPGGLRSQGVQGEQLSLLP